MNDLTLLLPMIWQFNNLDPCPFLLQILNITLSKRLAMCTCVGRREFYSGIQMLVFCKGQPLLSFCSYFALPTFQLKRSAGSFLPTILLSQPNIKDPFLKPKELFILTTLTFFKIILERGI